MATLRHRKQTANTTSPTNPMTKELVALLDEVLVTHSPCGLEQEMNEVITKHLSDCRCEIFHDPCDNLSVKFPGARGGPLTVVSAHKDEIALIVRKIDEDGRIWLEPLGGILPFKYGEGPFDLMTRDGIIEGVLCVGSTHSSDLSPRIHKAKTNPLTWDVAYLDCKLTSQELKERGVIVGDRALVGRKRKNPLYLRGNYVGGYALDDKAAVAILLILARMLAKTRPSHDVCLAFTASEEIGVSGGSYLGRQLDPHDFIAVEIIPVAEEYPVAMTEAPVVVFKDAACHHSPVLCRELIDAGTRCGMECQTAVIRNFGSDASVNSSRGVGGRSACVGFPTENTHGYEMAPIAAMANCVTLLFEHLTERKTGRRR